jgi:hypothetical protein
MLQKMRENEPVHFGPRTVREIPLSAVYELKQVRSEYSPASLQELATSMIIAEDLHERSEPVTSDDFDLSNPITVAYLDEAMARRYIADHAEHYQVAPTPVERVLNEEGMATLLIAGHRRKRSLEMLTDRFGMDADDITVSASVRENISFADALGLQLRENIHERPPVHDEARAIERFYRDVTEKQGERVPIKWFATRLGFSETKVRDALAFAQLPADIQAMVEHGQLSFSVVRHMRPLQEAYEKVYIHRYGEDDRMSASVHNSLMVDAMQLMSERLRGSETKPRQYIDNKIASVLDELTMQDALFELIPEDPHVRRVRVANGLSKVAIRTLEWQTRTKDLQPEARESLAELRAKIDEILRQDTAQQATQALF